MTTIFKKPAKRVFTIDISDWSTNKVEEALEGLMNEYKFNKGDWLRQYERKLLIENRIEKINQLNGITTFH